MDSKEFTELESKLSMYFDKLSSIQNTITNELLKYADAKTLKGNELVGWLGEIYTKLIFKGCLVDDSFEHDVEADGLRLSVKTRKGRRSGWNRTSAIPKIEGNECPTHLIFINLNDDYKVNTIWKFSWDDLYNANRFKEHIVRGNMRSYYFSINLKVDSGKVIYTKK